MQCQQTTLDLGAKLAAEKRDRDQDFDQVSLCLVIFRFYTWVIFVSHKSIDSEREGGVELVRFPN